MATHTPLSILKSFYAAELIYMKSPPETADFDIMAKTLTSDVKLIQTDGLPYAGTYTGREGFQKWATTMNELFSTVDVQDPEIFLSEDPESSTIIVKSKVRFVVRKTGEEFLDPFVQVVGVDLEKGQISEMRPFYWDVAGVNRRLGYSPQT